MMKNKIFTAIFILCTLTANAQKNDLIAVDLFKSLAANNFAQFQQHLPAKAQLELISPKEFAGNNGAKNLLRFKERLKNDWLLIAAEAKKEKVDLKQIKIADVFITKLEGSPNLKVLTTHFLMPPSKHGLFQFIITELNKTIYLVSIPKTSEFFKAQDEIKLQETLEEFKISNDTTIRHHVKAQLDSLKLYCKNKDFESFSKYCVYSGEDISRRWKDIVNIANPEEKKRTEDLFKNISFLLNNCQSETTVGFKMDKESEGIWYVYSIQCNDAKADFPFLKIRGKFCLGGFDLR